MIVVRIEYEIAGLSGEIPAKMVWDYSDRMVSPNSNPLFYATEIQRSVLRATTTSLRGLSPFVVYGELESYRETVSDLLGVTSSVIAKVTSNARR